MLELDRRVLGRITVKEIIGAWPPEIPDTRDILERELAGLLAQLESYTRERLERILDEQRMAGAHINSRPGAMALAQDKIQMYNRYNERYIQAITDMLKS